jgi:hypothetical protein
MLKVCHWSRPVGRFILYTSTIILVCQLTQDQERRSLPQDRAVFQKPQDRGLGTGFLQACCGPQAGPDTNGEGAPLLEQLPA